MGGALRWVAFTVALGTLVSARGTASINPWVITRDWTPQRWDTAGPDAATPWLHPVGWGAPKDEGDWGALDGHFWTTSALTGTWDGFRSWDIERGFSAAFAVSGQFAGNPIGGQKQGVSWRGDVGVAVFADFNRLVGWHGGYFTASFSYQYGNESISSIISNEMPIQLSNAFTDSTPRLVHLALGQELFDNTTEVVLGRIITAEDFGNLGLACTSLNQAICGNPILPNLSLDFPTYPSAVWGGRVKVKPGDAWYAMVGSYLVYPNFRSAGDHGVELGAPEGSGAFTLGEVGFMVGSDRKKGAGLPGEYKVGGYYDAERLTDFNTNEASHGTWGIYALGEQKLFTGRGGDGASGLSAFLAFSYGPPDKNLVSTMVAGGLVYQGLIEGRPHDSLGLISAAALYSPDLRASQRTAGLPTQNYEVLIELTYRIQVAPWLFVQPDIQAVINPMGYTGVPDALALGFGMGAIL